METIYSEEGKNPKIREIVKQYSRLKYGRKKIFVDQEITSRIGIDIAQPKKPEEEVPLNEVDQEVGVVDDAPIPKEEMVAALK